MIVRDEHGIIVQHNLDHPDQADGGDSASRTGIMALCGSSIDASRLAAFMFWGGGKMGLVRHPTQTKWMDPRLTSRDQLICWAAGFSAPASSIYRFACLRRCARAWFINKDFLTPDVRMFLQYMYKPSSISVASKVLGNFFLLAHVLLYGAFKKDAEQNQLVCMLLALSKHGTWYQKVLRWYIKLHGRLKENLLHYWGGKPWRDQEEIAQAMIKALAL